MPEAHAWSPVTGPAVVDGDLHDIDILIVLEGVAGIGCGLARVGNHEEGLKLGDGARHIGIRLQHHSGSRRWLDGA